jgi:hypothetical protein
MSKVGKFFVSHKSEVTGSSWEVEFNEDFDITRIYLNGVRFRLTSSRSDLVFNYLNKHKELQVLQHEAYCERFNYFIETI